MSSRNEKVLELERGSTKLHTMRNSLWKKLWTYRQTEYMMMMMMMMTMMIWMFIIWSSSVSVII